MLLLEDESLVHILPDLCPLLLPFSCAHAARAHTHVCPHASTFTLTHIHTRRHTCICTHACVRPPHTHAVEQQGLRVVSWVTSQGLQVRNLPNKIADRTKELGSDILSRSLPQGLEQSLREKTVQGLQTRSRRVPDKKTRFRGIAEFHLCEQGTVNRELSRISNWFLFTGFLIHDNALLRGSDGTLCRILSEEEVCMGIWLHLLWRWSQIPIQTSSSDSIRHSVPSLPRSSALS